MGISNSIKDCDHIIQTSDTVGSGNAFRFDGTQNYIDLPNSFKPNDGTNDYTIEIWVNPMARSGSIYLVHVQRPGKFFQYPLYRCPQPCSLDHKK